ncbi:hypothetical protein [Nonomuraea sp. NPDC050310]|uniref:hypothetical protein n=1 Tax=Nonomuraea sp. NPDC050310 TaxID=3154935 RepID=UPI0033FB7FC8
MLPLAVDHPLVDVTLWLTQTTPGQIVVCLVALLIACVLSPQVRRFVGPFWRLATGGLVLRRPGPWDSTFDRPAPERPEARPNFRGERYPRFWWSRIPGYQRMFWRWTVGATVYAAIKFPLPVLCLGTALGLYLLTRAVFRMLQDWAYERNVGTFALGVAMLLGEKRNPSEYIALPRLRLTMVPIALDERVTRAARRWPALERLLGRLAVPMLRIPLEADDARVLVQLDAKLTSDAVVKEVKSLGLARLPEGPWEAHHHAAQLVVELKHPRRPPAACWYDEEANRRFDVANVPIGMRAGKSGPEWVTLPLKDLTPHGVMSATTGWCKTTTANVYVGHTAGNGGKVFINDPKRVGYTLFKDLDNVVIRTTADGWADSVATFVEEMEWRYSLIERFPEIKENPELYFQPWFMLVDERGSYVADLKDWAKQRGEKGMPLPLRQEKKALWQGRAAGMYWIDLCQQANLSVFLDSDGRDQRMWRIASGPQTRSAWFMLFAGVAKKSIPMKKGRAMLGLGVDSVEEITLARVDDADARRFAEAGKAIADRENQARAKRLQALLEASVPVQDSAYGAGETAPSVPGHVLDRPETEELSATPEVSQSGVIPGDGGDDFDELRRLRMSLIRNDEYSESETNVASDREAGQSSELIVGVKAAANLLEMTEAAFIQARKRRPIQGETKKGISPAWTELDLREWRSQAKRAGAS